MQRGDPSFANHAIDLVYICIWIQESRHQGDGLEVWPDPV